MRLELVAVGHRLFLSHTALGLVSFDCALSLILGDRLLPLLLFRLIWLEVILQGNDRAECIERHYVGR